MALSEFARYSKPGESSLMEMWETWGRLREIAERNLVPDTEARDEWDSLCLSFQGILSSLVPDPKSRLAGYRERFYSRIDRDAYPGHAVWTGRSRDRSDGVPVYNWPKDGKIIRTTCARIMWFLERGNWPGDDRYLLKACDVPRCVESRCYAQTSTLAGRVPSARFDEHNNPVCKLGHVLRRTPRPGEKIYCRTCEAIKRQALQAHMAAGQSAQIAANRTAAPTPISLVQPDPDDTDDADDPRPVSAPPARPSGDVTFSGTVEERQAQLLAWMDAEQSKLDDQT